MYDTELMRKILSSPMAREIVNQLSPIYGDARVALWIFQAIGVELDDMKKWAQDIIDQVTPHNASWTLDYWEDEWGIPRDPTLSILARRERILVRMRTRAPMNPYNLKRLISAVVGGSECNIKERAGPPSRFEIFINAIPDQATIKRLRFEIDRAKQARLSYNIIYRQYSTGIIYAKSLSVGRYLRVTAPVKINGKVDAPRVPAQTAAGVRVSGAYALGQVRIAVDHIGWPRRELPIHTDVRVSETYISTSAEVPTEVSP